MARFKFHKIVAIGVAIATGVWVATGEFTSVGSAADESGPGPTAVPENEEAAVRTVGVITPPQREHSRAIRISGSTEADKRATLATRAAGIVAELPVRQGMRVEKGDLILKLDAEGKEAAVETARALLSQREAELEAAERLARSGNLPRLQLENTRSAVASARSQFEAATAELARNELYAPFSGLIDRVNIEQGSSVQAGTEVATILSLDPILAIGEVSERDLAHVAAGNRADVRLVSNQIVQGEVRHISRNASSATRTFRVEVAVPNAEQLIPAGMTAEITLRTEPVMATVLPRSVVTLSSDGDLGVRAVDADNKVVFYPIDLVDDLSEGLVLGGIPADVKIIVAGQEMVSEGHTVNTVAADADTLRRLAGAIASGTN